MVRSCARQNHFFHRVTCLCLLLGSPKIGTNCTSIMTARVYLNSQVSVSACHSNHGQSKTLQHLPLPKWQHKMMAAKIQHGVSRERILDNIRQSVNSTFNRQDLANLQRAYTLKNVLSWIGEWESEMGHQSPELYCKFLWSTFFNEWYRQPVLQHVGSCEGG